MSTKIKIGYFWTISILVSIYYFTTRRSVYGAETGSTVHANRLFEDLLSDYNKLVRPVADNNETMEVFFKLKLSQLIDVVNCD